MQSMLCYLQVPNRSVIEFNLAAYAAVAGPEVKTSVDLAERLNFRIFGATTQSVYLRETNIQLSAQSCDLFCAAFTHMNKCYQIVCGLVCFDSGCSDGCVCDSLKKRNIKYLQYW